MHLCIHLFYLFLDKFIVASNRINCFCVLPSRGTARCSSACAVFWICNSEQILELPEKTADAAIIVGCWWLGVVETHALHHRLLDEKLQLE